MIKITLKTVLMLSLIACGKNYQDKNLEVQQGAIINGVKVEAGQFSSVVALKDRKTKHKFCSATLIDSKTIYTASHCLATKEDLNALIKPMEKALEEFTEVEEKKSYIQTIVERYVKVKAKQMVIEVEGRDLDIVEGAQVSENWKLSLIGTLYTVFGIPLDESMKDVAQNPFHQDAAVITLKEEVTDVEIIPLLSEVDMSNLSDPVNATIRLVGYGLRKDQSEITSAADAVQFSGVKYSVDVNITFISPDGLKAYVGSKGFSACSGDSGGAAFIKLDDGSWRYFASITGGPAKGCGADFIEQFPDLDQSLNLGTTEIDLR